MNDLGLQRLLRGCEHVYTPEELERRLGEAAREGRPLRVKLGMDPTTPDIHLGHVVVLQKMRQFQDLGHKAVLIIGDFTAKVGDPTGRSQTRPVLRDEQIRANAQTYLDQAGRILDTSPEKLELRYNSEWLASMQFADVLRLTGHMTVQQMLKRDDFRSRYESQTPIGIHEFLYPLMQGWDSVNIRADVELGGTDQTYNNLVGRELQTDAGQPPQIVMILPILRGTDGKRKMSKTFGNTIALTDSPTDMFGKTMRISDDLLAEWFTLLTDIPEEEHRQATQRDPMKAKALLARRIGARFHGDEEMARAERYWFAHFSERQTGERVVVRLTGAMLENGHIPAWKLAWLAHGQSISRSEARRMVRGGAFEYEGKKVTDPNAAIPVRRGATFRAGRYRHGPRVKQPVVARVEIDATD